jgi:hypothetical protein
MAGGVGTQKAETLTRRLLHVGRSGTSDKTPCARYTRCIFGASYREGCVRMSAPGGTALLPPPPLTAGTLPFDLTALPDTLNPPSLPDTRPCMTHTVY